MNNKKYVAIVKMFAIIILFVLLAFVLNGIYTSQEALETKDSLITKQTQVELDFKVDGFTLDNPNIILNPYGNSPLTALIIFETEKSELPKITVKGKDEWSTIEGTSMPGRQHFVPIYGLYAEYNNEIVIKVGETEKTLMIKTESLPEDIAIPTNVVANKNVLDNQLYFFTPASKGYTSAYDVNGDIRWYLTDKMVWDIDRLNNGRLLLSTERSINPPYFTTGLYEIDLLGKIYNEYNLPGGYHHDFFELENGNLLVASDEFHNELGTVEDIIVELNRETGEVIKTWDLKNVLNMEDGKSENWTNYDWFHNNSVWYDKESNLIVLSGRHQDAVIAIDYNTSELKWIIGDPTGWSEEYQKYFFTPEENQKEFEWQWSQHAAMITPEGNVFILDNGNNKSKIKEEYVTAEDSYTRGVMYQIDTANMTIKQIWQYGKERGYEFYSPYISDVDYIDENHYLIHSGGIVYVDGEISNEPAGLSKGKEIKLHSTTVEVLNDEVIFELTLPTNMYRAERMHLYNNSFFELTKAGRLGSLGKTDVDNEEFGLPFGYVTSNEYLKKYKVTLTKEEDRLILNGMFSQDDKVKVILYDKFKMKYYNIVISQRPYTALCIDIFTQCETDDTLEINKYINDEGLAGDYSVYLQINDELYNTEKYVNFD